MSRLRAALAVALAALCPWPLLIQAPSARAVADTPGPARAATGSPHRDHGAGHPVSVVTYDLGDQVYTDPRVTSYEKPFAPVPMELAAVVHYPSDLGSSAHPLVVIEHGSWWACYNPTTRKPNGHWPCPPGSHAFPSDRGYDYLARSLARRGFVVVSISNNAINAHVLGDQEATGRADLVNQHLQMWQQLATTGTGPLAGAFVDPGTGSPEQPDFVGHVDTQHVGTVGHSRGGKGVLWQAADRHRSEWPAGVSVRAVVALAPAYDEGRVDPADTRVTDLPLLIVSASCDGAVGPDVGTEYLHDLHGRNPGASTVSIRGGNHDFFNTRWSPGHPTGYDDATTPCPGELTAAQQRRRTVRLLVPFLVQHVRE